MATGIISSTPIKLDGRVFNRATFTISLRPGINPLVLPVIPGSSLELTITRRIPGGTTMPIHLTDEGKKHLRIDEPAAGFVTVKQGDPLQVSGEVMQTTEMQVIISKYTKAAAQQLASTGPTFAAELTFNNGAGY